MFNFFRKNRIKSNIFLIHPSTFDELALEDDQDGISNQIKHEESHYRFEDCTFIRSTDIPEGQIVGGLM